MNHDNEYHQTINYGNRFPDDWYFNSDKDSLLNDKQEEQQRKRWNQSQQNGTLY